MSKTIYCGKCDQHLDVECFYASYVKPSTNRLDCKKCQSKTARAWALAHPRRAQENLKAYHSRRSEKLKSTDGYLTNSPIHCRICKRDLPVDNFYKNYIYAKSKRGKCKQCSCNEQRAWKLANVEKAAEWRATSSKYKAWRSAWGKRNRANINKYMNAWYATNRAEVGPDVGDKTRANRGTKTPAWADKKAMREIYAEARRLTKETGIEHNVDHIIPLKGKTVCGLHIETNLRIVPAAINRRKANKFGEEVRHYEPLL